MLNRVSKFFSVLCMMCAMPGLLYGSGMASRAQGLPSGVCTNTYYQCDARTHRIWGGFQGAAGINIGKQGILSVGQCSRNGKWGQQVYILVAISPLADKVYFDAKISFYNDLSAYRHSPVSHIPAIFPDIYRPENRIVLMDTHAYIDYPGAGVFRYWLRFNKFMEKMMMVAWFGYRHTLVCEFKQ